MKVSQNIKVAVDAVVFGYSNKLKILLIQQKFGVNVNKWALPGGFIKDTETLKQAVIRELKEETGVKANYLEQLYTFGAINRDDRARVITISYIALINPKNYFLKATTDAKDAKWFNINNIPKLAFDHKEIIDKGLERLKAKINYQPIGFELLSSKFPFSDLENLYQIILEKKMDRRNFRKKMLSFGILQETSEFQKTSIGRPAKLFKFNETKYKELERKGFHFEIKFT
ncbi:MAG: NUDIX hydrolase [Flavobacteriaceae bacterium]|nr:NUDIX hydrolase [Flavobacteriaceae bacterium]